MRAYLCQQPYPRDEGAVEDVRPSAAATGGDVLVSSHWFEQRREGKKSDCRQWKKKVSTHSALSIQLENLFLALEEVGLSFSIQKKDMKRLEQHLRSLLVSSRGGRGAPAAAAGAEGAAGDLTTTVHPEEASQGMSDAAAARPLAETRFVVFIFARPLWRELTSLSLRSTRIFRKGAARCRAREGKRLRQMPLLFETTQALFCSLHRHHHRVLSRSKLSVSLYPSFAAGESVENASPLAWSMNERPKATV